VVVTDARGDIDISSHEWDSLENEHFRFCMHAVVQSEHKGASVEKLRVTLEITYDASARSYAPIMVECEDYRDSRRTRPLKSSSMA